MYIVYISIGCTLFVAVVYAPSIDQYEPTIANVRIPFLVVTVFTIFYNLKTFAFCIFALSLVLLVLLVPSVLCITKSLYVIYWGFTSRRCTGTHLSLGCST